MENKNLDSESNFIVLRRKDIILILDGDVAVGSHDNYELKMPYLSGTELLEISEKFGLCQDYGACRWTYLYELIPFSIEKHKCSELLQELFDISHFSHLTGLPTSELVVARYKEICRKTIDRINAILVTEGFELKRYNAKFYMLKIGEKITPSTPNVKELNASYIKKLSERCQDDLLNGDYDSVITKSRTMIEEVLTYVLESRNIESQSKGNIGKLYNEVKSALNMKQDKTYDGRVNSLLSGLERIVESISTMRNINSDAHGVGNKRITVREPEARLAMNSAMTFCEYILSIVQNKP